MKILRVSSDLYPSIVGGVSIHIHEMSKMQAELGNDVTVYTSRWSNEPKEESRDTYGIVRFNGFSIMRNAVNPSLFFELQKTKNDFDIIHAHSHLYSTTNFCALARRLGSPPLIITNHGLNSQTVPMWIQNIYLPTVGKWTFKSADTIICYTEYERNVLIRMGIDPSKIVVIHNGVDTNVFVPDKKNEEKCQILWVGKYIPGKGVEYLIEAISILVKKYPDVKVLMVGKGPLKEQIIQKIHDQNIEKYISLRDFVPNYEIPELYQNSDIFVLPSIYEGIPRTILESMSCGVPVVCTELPQLVDIVSGSGLLVPIKDSQALAGALDQLISNPERAQKFGENGRKSVISNYSWEDTVRRTLDLYRDVVEISMDGKNKAK